MTTLIESIASDPLVELAKWIERATISGLKEPNAMALATATSDGRPSVRMVLCKGIEHGAVYFYTNYESRKANELQQNPRAALCFHWPDLGLQARLEGAVSRASRQESAAYFASRPHGSQVGAWVSKQSRPVESYAALVRAFEQEAIKRKEKEVPCPPFWGGYKLVPEVAEFWVSVASRLHDRVLYRVENRIWKKAQLYP